GDQDDPAQIFFERLVQDGDGFDHHLLTVVVKNYSEPAQHAAADVARIVTLGGEALASPREQNGNLFKYRLPKLKAFQVTGRCLHLSSDTSVQRNAAFRVPGELVLLDERLGHKQRPGISRVK